MLRSISCRLLCVFLGLAGLGCAPAWGQELKSADIFEKIIRPTLIEHCQRCHGKSKQQGGLRLDHRDGWAVGGERGSAIVPGDGNSLLLSAIRFESPDLEMPPRGKLPAETIRAFEQWIRSGAIDPRTLNDSRSGSRTSPPTIERGRDFWTFQPITRPQSPEVKDETWPRSEIDRFILARLEASNLAPASQADKPTIVRRLYYDLIGLPPTPNQIDDFLGDNSPTAYADLVDRLLDSHHFGQRWGRHWLDVVRFSQSSGGGRTLLFPDAWRYRDYVIESFNEDVPYDRFLTQQIAGDLLPVADHRERTNNLIATAFLLLGPTNYELQDKDVLEMDVVDEQIDTIGKALLGMTIGCARCHDHKFDPIPAHDYYALAGIMKSTQSLIHSNVSTWNTTRLPLPDNEEAKYSVDEQTLLAAQGELKKLNQELGDAKAIDPSSLPGLVAIVDDVAAEKIGKWNLSTSNAGYVGKNYLYDSKAPDGENRVVFRMSVPRTDRYEVRASYTASSNRATQVPFQIHHLGGETVVRVNQREQPSLDGAFVSLGVYEFESGGDGRVEVYNDDTSDGVVIADSVILISETVPPESSDRDARSTEAIAKQEQKEKVAQLTEQIAVLKKKMPERFVAMSVTDSQNPGDIHLAIRGQTHSNGDLVRRGVLQVACWDEFPTIETSSGRRELAEWIVDRNNPLTARVMANRVWYWLIGRGIVSTVDNFGTMGDLPTHPALLDHLATSLIDSDWSTKSLIREIVMSQTYRQSSAEQGSAEQGRAVAVVTDPENRLLWRMNRKRLRAEDIRDSFVFVSGQLDRTIGGPNLKLGTKQEYGYEFDSPRRSVYLPVFRYTLPEAFEVFDFADPNIQQGSRMSSTVASQSLWLMNHPFVMEQSKHAAQQLLSAQVSDLAPPRSAQVSDLAADSAIPESLRPSATIVRIEHAYRQVIGRPPTPGELAAAIDLIGSTNDNFVDTDRWAMLYQVLFQCIDFRYLD